MLSDPTSSARSDWSSWGRVKTPVWNFPTVSRVRRALVSEATQMPSSKANWKVSRDRAMSSRLLLSGDLIKIGAITCSSEWSLRQSMTRMMSIKSKTCIWLTLAALWTNTRCSTSKIRSRVKERPKMRHHLTPKISIMVQLAWATTSHRVCQATLKMMRAQMVLTNFYPSVVSADLCELRI